MSQQENSSENRARLKSYIRQVKELRDLFSETFDTMSESDWQKPHGPDWVMPFLPYHLEYFDRLVILDPIRLGAELPEEACHSWSDMSAINAWNVPMIEAFDPEVLPEAHIAAWQATTERLVQMLEALDDEALTNRKVWNPLMGWTTVLDTLPNSLPHNWNHLHELALRLDRDIPTVSDELMQTGLAFYTKTLTMLTINREALNEPYKIVMTYTGYEHLKWTIEIGNARYNVLEGANADANLTVTQAPISLVKTLTEIHHPALAVQSGDILLSDSGQWDTFAQYFPMFALPAD